MNLYEERARAFEAAKGYMDLAAAENRELTADEQQAVDKAFADIDRLTEQINRREKLAAIDAALRATPAPQLAGGQGDAQGGEITGKQAFLRYLRAGSHALTAQESRALTIAPDTAGGYTVPDEFERQIIQGLVAANVLRQLATTITTSGDRNIPVVSGHGSAAWINEEGTYTPSDETFSQVTLSAYKAGTLIKVSEELLNDSAFDLESYVAGEFSRRIGALEETAFVNGSGSGQPTGVIGSAGLGKATASSLAVTSDELIDMYYSLKRQYRSKAVWLLADSTEKVFRKLKNGTTGDYMWQPGLTAGQPNTLLGRPIYISDEVPALAASAKIALFGDFSYYWIADRGGRYFQRLVELYAVTGHVGFRAFERVDGKLVLAEAMKYLQMSATS